MDVATMIILYILAIYGFIQIMLDIISIYMQSKVRENGITLCVLVKNQENKIEYFLRSLIFNILKNRMDDVLKIYVCDMGSKDDTYNIVSRLSNNNKYIQVIDKNSIDSLFDKETNSV